MSRRNGKSDIPPQPGWAIYLRTSDQDNQDPENSQKRQREAIRRNLTSHSEMPVFDEYIDNLSGRYAHNRRSYQRLLDDARAGKFSYVAVENAERFGRNDTEALRAIDELNELGVAIRFADYPDLDPVDPDDRIMVSLSFTLARRESIKLGQRVKGGLHAKLRSGGIAGIAPDGYKNMEKKTEGHEKLKHGKYTRWIEQDEERAKIWRFAWDMLLTDAHTLDDICEALHEKGYRYRTGRAFVEVQRNGKRWRNINTMSRIFHNWFYAGWVVSEKASIPPKEVRGQWEPLVTTEEFERGLEILATRDQHRIAQRKHEYLLKSLVYVQTIHDRNPAPLTCSTTNASRPGGGTRYYCISRSNLNIPCNVVDEQVAALICDIQVDAELLPLVRAAYTSELAETLGHNRPADREQMEAALKAITDEEARAARLYASGKITDEVWDSLWADWQDRRSKILRTLEGLERQKEHHIANLDSALTIIAKIGLLYNGLERSDQRELLRQMVERIVVDPEGKIIRLELLPPFAYLHHVSRRVRGKKSAGRENKTTSPEKTGRLAKRSIWIPLGVLDRIESSTSTRATVMRLEENARVWQVNLIPSPAKGIRTGDILSLHAAPFCKPYPNTYVYYIPNVAAIIYADIDTGFPLERTVTAMTIFYSETDPYDFGTLCPSK